jgi:hypothetical protein
LGLAARCEYYTGIKKVFFTYLFGFGRIVLVKIIVVNPNTRREMAKQDWVLTPNGYRHRSLVHALQKDELMEGAGAKLRIRSRNHEAILSLDRRVAGPDMKDALTSGRWAYAGWTNSREMPITAFRVRWQVPEAPREPGEQVIFLFSGIEDGSAAPFILLPGLQWGLVGAYWTLACWYAGPPGHASVHGPLVLVQPGETLTGVVTLMGQTPNGCSYSCHFEEYLQTKLIVTDRPELTRCTLCLEAYGVDNCNDFPGGETRFSPIQLATRKGNINPRWTAFPATADCGPSGTLAGNGTAACVFSIRF